MKFQNDLAEEELDAMKYRLEGLKFVFGPTDERYTKALTSFEHVMGFIENNPDSTLFKEGDLSIGISTEWIYCAAIWHRDKDYDGYHVQPGTWSFALLKRLKGSNKHWKNAGKDRT